MQLNDPKVHQIFHNHPHIKDEKNLGRTLQILNPGTLHFLDKIITSEIAFTDQQQEFKL